MQSKMSRGIRAKMAPAAYLDKKTMASTLTLRRRICAEEALDRYLAGKHTSGSAYSVTVELPGRREDSAI